VLVNAAGWTMAELARRSRLDQSAVARLLRGDLRPGPRTIAGLLLAFSDKFPKIGFYDLFELIEHDGRIITPVGGGDEEQVPA
jgi:transcriptional regulator with XRE-family HTH domain